MLRLSHPLPQVNLWRSGDLQADQQIRGMTYGSASWEWPALGAGSVEANQLVDDVKNQDAALRPAREKKRGTHCWIVGCRMTRPDPINPLLEKRSAHRGRGA